MKGKVLNTFGRRMVDLGECAQGPTRTEGPGGGVTIKSSQGDGTLVTFVRRKGGLRGEESSATR